MSGKPLCPLKFTNPRPAEAIDWSCEENQCAWWSKGGERCAIVTISMGLWAILETIKDKGTENDTKKGH